jgi:hypothetical protein
MATLTITIGPISGTVTTTNAKATAIVTQYAAAIGAVGTDEQKLNQVVLALAKHMQQQGRQHRKVKLHTDALAAAQAEMDALWWDQPEAGPGG